MKKSFSEYTDILHEQGNKRILINQLILLLLLNLAMVYSFLVIFAQVISSSVISNIYEYNEVDLQHLCDISMCKFITKNNNTYVKGATFLIPYTKAIHKTSIGGGIYITDDFDIAIDIITKDFTGYVVIDNKTILKILREDVSNILIGSFIMNIFITFIILYTNHKVKFREDSDRESTLYFQSMVMISENLHHELNTPLAVINSKIEKLHKIYNEVVLSNIESPKGGNRRASDIIVSEIMENSSAITKDFKLIGVSLDQIEDTLNRMKQFKTLRHHSQDISLYEVIQATFDVLGVTNPEKFSYEIDSEFHNIKLDNNFLQNGEFTNIILNFAKNSLEAHAQSIKVSVDKVKGSTLTLFFADNGNGIANKYINSIFSQDSSTKGDKRGNGLYINKFILNSSEGDSRLFHTSEEGTVFEIKVRVTNV
jgi:signal transduction histidine kinase